MTVDVRDRIEVLLSGAGGRGCFSAAQTAPTDDLCLEVRGFGPVEFPVSNEQARKLCALGRSARYGKWAIRITAVERHPCGRGVHRGARPAPSGAHGARSGTIFGACGATAVIRIGLYGKGEQTLVDPTVRNTWEIPTSRLKFDKRRWAGCNSVLALADVHETWSAFEPEHQHSWNGRDDSGPDPYVGSR